MSKHHELQLGLLEHHVVGRRSRRGPIGRRSWWARAWPTLLLIVVLTGCSRGFYRHQADADAACLVSGYARDPQWQAGGFSVAPKAYSRLADPHCPDHSPMPPDDPEAHRLMHCVDGKCGHPCWHAHGDLAEVDQRLWLNSLAMDEAGELELDLDSAVRLARQNSRDYQEQLEDLYLSALDVSFERFRFDTQFFTGYGLTYTADGPLRPGAGGESSSALDLNSPFRSNSWEAHKLFASGSELAVSLANELMWQFSGPDTQSARTVIDLSLIQPLLRDAGRSRVLERLTLAERTLLANVRLMERYRQGFYVEIVAGRDAGNGPERRGGVFGSGLEGFSGLAGGFGRVTGGSSSSSGTGAGQASGFLGLMQAQQEIRNQEANVAALRGSLAQLRFFFSANRVDGLQVELARQALLNAQSRLLTLRTSYDTRLDAFKLALGLPPQLPVKVSAQATRQFNLIDAELQRLQSDVTTRQEAATTRMEEEFAAWLSQAEVNAEGKPVVQWTPRLAKFINQLAGEVPQLEEQRKSIETDVLNKVAADVDRFAQALEQRRQELERLEERGLLPRESAKPKAPGAAGPGTSDLDRLLAELQQGVQKAQRELAARGEEIALIGENLKALAEQGPNLPPDKLEEAVRAQVFFGRDGGPVGGAAEVAAKTPAVTRVLADLATNLGSLSVIQAEARVELVSLTAVELSPETALEIAREHRLDWMNARAALVDAWRLIEFNADQLESTLNVVFRGDVQNANSNPLSLNDTTGRLQVGVQFDAPLTRLSERNTYRQSQIEYQQARRGYMAYEDGITATLRDSLRNVDLFRANFELRRSAVHVAARQVDLATLQLQEPPKPNVANAGSSEPDRLGPTRARDLVTALSDLLDAQNDFLSVYINYEALRRTLAYDMGVMQLDCDGVWLDPGEMGAPSAALSTAPEAPKSLSPTTSRGDTKGPSSRYPVAPAGFNYAEAADSPAVRRANYEVPLPPPSELRLRR